MKRMAAAVSALAASAAFAFLPPVDTSGGLELRILGFDERQERKELQVVEVDASRPLEIRLSLANGSSARVDGTLKVWLNDDWTVEGPVSEAVSLAPGEKRGFVRSATALPRAIAALYPVHATFEAAGATLHPIAVFKAKAKKSAWTPERRRDFVRANQVPSEEAWAALEKKALASAAAGEFPLRGPGGDFAAGVAPGANGLFDGALAFADGAGRSVAYRGFACEVDGVPVGCGPNSVPVEKVDVERGRGALALVHRLPGGIVLRARLSAKDGALRLAWDMPGVARTPAGAPRYSKLCLGPSSDRVWRGYLGFGNVVVNPRKFQVQSNGFGLSTRHVGMDFANGLSLVQACDVWPDRLESDGAAKVFALVAHHDATFTFVPSAAGAFAAARRFADLAGYRKSPGVDALAGRVCLDSWSPDCDRMADEVALAAKYGMADSVFVMHNWQRWGYDYRLPEIYPPHQGEAGFNALRSACRGAGVLFCPHDNYTDVYPDSEGYSYDLTVFDPDGTPQLAWYNAGRRAQSYRWAPDRFGPYLRRNAKLLKDGCDPDGIFIDVLTAHPAFDFYGRDGTFHPKSETVGAWCAAFDDYRRVLGKPSAATISEAGADVLIGHVDAGEADHFGANRWFGVRECDDFERVPWHDVVSHGKMVLFAGGLGPRYAAKSWDGGGDNERHGYGSDDYISNAVIGGRAAMAGGPFNRKAVRTYWLQHDLAAAFAAETFESHEFAGGDIHRQHTRFSGGAEAWSNRGTNGTWSVGGRILPQYGFYAKAKGVEAAVEERGGRAVAWSRTKDVLYADANPPVAAGRVEGQRVASEATGAKVVAPDACEIETKWTVRAPVKGYSPFVHVVPEGAGETPIVFQGRLSVGEADLAKPGEFAATVAVRLPKGVEAGRYDVRYGLFKGPRLDIAGLNDAQRRIRGGTLVVEKSGGTFARLSWLPPSAGAEAKPVVADFGGFSTDGAVRFEHPAKGPWRLTPLPKSVPFAVEIDLGAFGAKGRRVKGVRAVDPSPEAGEAVWLQRGDRLSVSADAFAFAYEIGF